MTTELVGKTLSHYRVLAAAGAGGMGVVYRAYDERLKRHVAIKTLPAGTVSNEATRRRIRDEALALSKLNHPGIETVFDFDTQDGVDFLVMEFLEGKTLAEEIATRRFADSDIASIGGQIAEALHAAHKNHVIHRDLKPSNVLVSEEGHPKLLDFGIAKVVAPVDDTATTETETSSASVPKGTIPYMAPEQLRAEPVDARTDIHALGVLLYEMATGQRPFRGATQTALIEAICHASPAPPRAIRPGLGARIEEVILKCLEKDPKRRYQSAIEVRVDLERALAPSTGPAGPVVASRGIRRAMVWGAGIAGLSLLAWLTSPLWGPLAARLLAKWIPAPKVTEGRQVTFSGKVRAMALSPDGASMAYALSESQTTESATYRVVVQDFSGGAPHQVFQGGMVTSLAWSPDGTSLACAATADRGNGVYLVPRFGGEPRFIPATVRGITWSPDGTKLAGWRVPRREIVVIGVSASDSNVVSLPAEFVWVKGVEWSPDGTRFALATENQGSVHVLWTLRADGRDLRAVLRDSVALRSPRWSPGGNALYYLRGTEPVSDLCRLPIAARTGRPSGPPRTLLEGRGFGVEFSLSRDGRRLLYPAQVARSNLWSLDLRRLDRDSAFAATRLTEGTFQDEDPSHSPTGRRLAFTRREGSRANIHVINAGGDSLRQLTFLNSVNTQPVWSPSGEEIAFNSSEGGRGHRLSIMSATGGPSRPCGRSAISPDAWTLAWAPGGRPAVTKPGNREIVLIDPETGEERRLDDRAEEGWRFTPNYSPGGSQLAYFWNRKDQGGIWRTVLADGTAHPVATGVNANVAGWSEDARWIYYLDYARDPVRLHAATVDGNARKFLGIVRVPGLPLGFSMSRDGRRAVAACAETVSDLWLIDSFESIAR